jgi:hypothetical protein
MVVVLRPPAYILSRLYPDTEVVKWNSLLNEEPSTDGRLRSVSAISTVLYVMLLDLIVERKKRSHPTAA